MAFPDRPFFDAVYTGLAPGDVEAAQPDLITLIEDWPPRGRVLDLGCGTGDLAIELARRGYEVLGVDFAEAAIGVARGRAGALPAESRARLAFQVGDALHLSPFGGAIGAVVDSGFYHLFDPPVRAALARELGVALPRGGRYYMLGFAIEIPSPDAPRQVKPDEIDELFSAERGWKVLAARPSRFVTRGFGDIPALAVCVERTE